ncbi:MAG TPA: hypothetical protein VMS86_05995, partial [Thermoanaerobaculia bacterium]|nr:hypothetical protein [Thermoanaerobaculia bacterium]
MRGVAHPPPEVFDAWAELWRGLAMAHDRRLRLEVERAGGGAVFTVTRAAARAARGSPESASCSASSARRR